MGQARGFRFGIGVTRFWQIFVENWARVSLFQGGVCHMQAFLAAAHAKVPKSLNRARVPVFHIFLVREIEPFEQFIFCNYHSISCKQSPVLL